MKKNVLSIVLLLLVYLLNAQDNNLKLKGFVKPEKDVGLKLSEEHVNKLPEIVNMKSGRSTNAIEYIPLGEIGSVPVLSPNTMLWADPNLNAVTFSRRITCDSSKSLNIGYDVSLNKGDDWETGNLINLTGLVGTPQGGILNPQYNNNPENAYYIFISQLEENGHIIGANKLTQNLNPDFIFDTIPNFESYVKDFSTAFTITQKGEVWLAGILKDKINNDYAGEVIVANIQVVNNHIVYSEQLISYELPQGSVINDVKIDFDPYGEIGFICLLSNEQLTPVPFTSYHPVLFRTTNGGESWSNPINVQMGGVNGIESIKYYWSDAVLGSIYGQGFERDEIYYNMGYDCDIAVDSYGNPHITGIIALATESGWYPVYPAMATWHVFSSDSGTTWDAIALYDNFFFEGSMGNVQMYNMPYASSTIGDLMFFSWIDTDLNGAEANTNPDIFIIGYDAETQVYSEIKNVTSLTLHWHTAYFGNMARYFFCDEDDLEIPMVILDYEIPGNTSSDVVFSYIQGVTIYPVTNCQLVSGVGENVGGINSIKMIVSPNPVNRIANIIVSSEFTGLMELSVFNIMGYEVIRKSVIKDAVSNSYIIDVSNLASGIYFNTIWLGEESLTKKMVVE